MILDRLQNSARYVPLHPKFAEAFAFLSQARLAELAPGRHEIVGTQVYAMVAKGEGRPREVALLEGHRKYIDIQMVLSGVEEMGWRPHTAESPVATPYDAAKEAALYSGQPDAWVTVRPGQFAVFFPEDEHAPLVGKGEIRKVIVKVAV
jgi:YhcH/YjgK/YiaL family protein